MKKLNIEQIVSIHVYKKRRNTDYIYRNKRKRFFFKDEDEGFYWQPKFSFRFEPVLTPKMFIETRGFIIDGKDVYYKPHVFIHMSNGVNNEKFFETENDLDAFMQSKEIKGITFIDY